MDVNRVVCLHDLSFPSRDTEEKGFRIKMNLNVLYLLKKGK